MGQLPQLFMDTCRLPAIRNIVDQDIPLIGQAISSSFTAVYCTLMLCTSIGLLFTINLTMAVVLLGLMPVYGLVAVLEGRHNGDMSSLVRRDERVFKAFREELLSMNSIKRTLGQEEALDGALAKMASSTCARVDALSVHTAAMQQHLALINVLFNAFELGYGGYLIMTGQLSVGAWIAFYSAAGSATPLVPTIAESLRQWNSAREALTLMRGIEALRPEKFKNTTHLHNGASLALENVCFTYFPSPGPMSLVNVCCLVPSGSKVALCGRSGCGKTTLMRLLSRLYQPTSGRIVVNGVCLNEIDVSTLIAVVEQEIVLFDNNIMENIRIANPSARARCCS
jgi:ATP-binding cassette subfamily B protein